MRELLIKYAPILIGLTALADTQMELLSSIGLSDTAIGWIKLTGLLLALFLPSVRQTFSKGTNSDPIRIDKDTKKF